MKMTTNRIAVCAGFSIAGVGFLSSYDIHWAVVAAITALFIIFLVSIDPQ